DDPLRGKPIYHRDEFGHAVSTQVGKYRKLGFRLHSQSAPDQRLTGFDEPVKRAAPPTFLDVPSVASAILPERHFFFVALPGENTALVHRMQGVNENRCAGDRQTARQSALTKTRERCRFGMTCESRLGDPNGDLCQL